MPRPPKGGAADEAAAEATAAAIAKELRGKFDSEVVRKEALKMYKTFSGVLDAEAVSKKIMAKREANYHLGALVCIGIVALATRREPVVIYCTVLLPPHFGDFLQGSRKWGSHTTRIPKVG